MRNVLKNHSEVCHFWANKIQSEGKASNMFFENGIIYSYGYHFPIAKHIKDGLILFTSEGYSVSTSKHISYTRRAIPHGVTVLTVPNIEIDNSIQSGNFPNSYNKKASLFYGGKKHIDNIEYYISEIKDSLGKSERARKYKEFHLNRVLALIIEMKKYLEIFRVKSKLPNSLKTSVNMAFNMDFSEINDIIKAEQEIQKKADLKRKAEQEKKFLELLPKWRKGEVNSLPYSNRQYLRVTNSGFKGTSNMFYEDGIKLYKNIEIQTSLNVKIDVETFKKYYSILKSGKSLVNEKISHYRVNKQDDKLLTIGCHKIELKEVELIANQLGV